MPELPDVELYLRCLEREVVGHSLLGIRMLNPFVLRTVAPRPNELIGKTVVAVSRLGKRIVLEFSDDLFVVFHLMISGRFRWLKAGSKPPAKISHAYFEFENGVLVLTEASSKKRASIHVLACREGLSSHDPGGIDPLTMSLEAFREQLLAENRTLKRALTNSHRFSGIGNAYSDEILFDARLSPLRLTSSLKDEEIVRLHSSVVAVLQAWKEKLAIEFATKFPGPGDVTAFRPDFNAHGKFGQPCSVCGHKIQRIQYAENETNYCAHCQNEGRLLADRSLSRLLKDDWPKTLEEMEQ